MVAPPRPVGVEIGGHDLVADQVTARWTIRLNRPSGGDVVGGDAVAQNGQGPCAQDIGKGLAVDAGGHTGKVGRVLHVGAVATPGVGLALGGGNLLPGGGTGKHVAVAAAEHFGGEGRRHHRLDFSAGGPNIFQIHRVTSGILANGVGFEVDG